MRVSDERGEPFCRLADIARRVIGRHVAIQHNTRGITKPGHDLTWWAESLADVARHTLQDASDLKKLGFKVHCVG
jgi:G:T-mismatch repair DNA endonuclease (very short patch repair protein)